MRITVKSSGMRGFTILVPTRMLCSPTLLHLGMRIGRKYTSEVPNISKQDLKTLCKAVIQAKRRYGHYELVTVESSDGDLVRITL